MVNLAEAVPWHAWPEKEDKAFVCRKVGKTGCWFHGGVSHPAAPPALEQNPPGVLTNTPALPGTAWRAPGDLALFARDIALAVPWSCVWGLGATRSGPSSAAWGSGLGQARVFGADESPLQFPGPRSLPGAAALQP